MSKKESDVISHLNLVPHKFADSMLRFLVLGFLEVLLQMLT